MILFALVILGIIFSLVENVEISQFTAKVYWEIAQKNSSSFLVCPISVKLVLALLQIGAGGRTAEELANVLDLPRNPQDLENRIRQLVSYLQGNQYYEFRSANKMYVENGFAIKKKYKSDAISIFKAEVQSINFGNPEAAARTVNRWIRERTNNKIKGMVSESDFSELTPLVLISAMYFHGKWATKFNKEQTKKGLFYRHDYDRTIMDMMEIKSKFNYHTNKTLSATFLELPYQGQDVTMTMVLPYKSHSLSELEARLPDVLAPVKYRVVTVTALIPKFTIKSKIEFTPILKHLGIKKAFSPHANLSGITNSVLSLSEVMQKTFIEVDEEGTTTAASIKAQDSVKLVQSIENHLQNEAPLPNFLRMTEKLMDLNLRYSDV